MTDTNTQNDTQTVEDTRVLTRHKIVTLSAIEPVVFDDIVLNVERFKDAETGIVIKSFIGTHEGVEYVGTTENALYKVVVKALAGGKPKQGDTFEASDAEWVDVANKAAEPTNKELALKVFEETQEAVAPEFEAGVKALTAMKKTDGKKKALTVEAGKHFAAAKLALGSGEANVSKAAWGIWMVQKLPLYSVNYVSELIRVSAFTENMVNSVPEAKMSAKSMTSWHDATVKLLAADFVEYVQGRGGDDFEASLDDTGLLSGEYLHTPKAVSKDDTPETVEMTYEASLQAYLIDLSDAAEAHRQAGVTTKANTGKLKVVDTKAEAARQDAIQLGSVASYHLELRIGTEFAPNKLNKAMASASEVENAADREERETSERDTAAKKVGEKFADMTFDQAVKHLATILYSREDWIKVSDAVGDMCEAWDADAANVDDATTEAAE